MINNKNEILNKVLDKELLDYDAFVKDLVLKEKEDGVFDTNNITTPLACVNKMFSYLPDLFLK